MIRKIFAVIAGLILMVFFALAIGYLYYRQSVVSMIGIERYIFVYSDGGVITSPAAKHTLRITYLDGGATHSGNFKTYLSVHDFVGGSRSVAEGFSSYPVRYGQEPFPIKWLAEDSFEMTFVQATSQESSSLFVKLNP